MQKIHKILVANRGEIAMRVMRSAKENSIKTVAVFSEADRNAPHVQYADQAVCIGPPASAQSYLLGEKIISIALELNVSAIHPGYGFLSENADFAKKVTDAGLIFIGPSPEAIKIMGDKLAAKAAVKSYDIPMIPGTDTAVEDVNEAIKIAEKVGYPILIKASAGGGGKGMRVVEKPEDFEEQMNLAVSEASSAFGDGSVFIERYVNSPRHIEIQIMADNQGNTVYLFERECSIQRRHQKVVEEAPSAVLTPELRKEMGQCAVRVAKACSYTGAGTVEFLLENNTNFYFLEMNTRLQVEHPVTELITGVDLVKEQIAVAEGQPLSFKQEDLKINGHAIEIRVYAEDPTNKFMPDIGTLSTYQKPEGIGIRVDDGFKEGMEIPIYYDPLISKLITYGRDREEAIHRMIRAIDDYKVVGAETTLPFGKYVMQHQSFVSGNYNTHFVKDFFTGKELYEAPTEEEMEIAAYFATQAIAENSPPIKEQLPQNSGISSNWRIRRL